MEPIVFGKKEMCEFIDQFDSTEKKYGISKVSDCYFDAVKYDNSCRSINLKKSNVHGFIDSTKMVYNNVQQSIDYGLIYINVLDKFLLKFVSIPKLASLYDSHYMDFEWNMHSNLDFEKYTNSYYRDHFIHQVRNMFMVFQLIDDEYIYYNIRKAITSSTRSKVTQYFNVRFNEWLNDVENDSRLKALLVNIAREKNMIQDEYFKEYFTNYVIRASLIISCLFHDIGYPVSYYSSVKERLINFIPAVYSIMGDNNFDFNYIYSILSESVLFQFVSKDEICQRFGRNDHGTISAILVGIFFYKTGLIHSLSPENQTAVEFGILAIYNHTLGFKSCKPKEKTDYIKMQFMLNPISYMLRWCDDMQEWDREYFEIASASNLLFCSKCKMPLRKRQLSPAEYFRDNNIVWNNKKYQKLDKKTDWSRSFFGYTCACQQKFSFTKRDDFNRRTLTQIKACDNVVIRRYDDKGEWKMIIEFHYNPYKLLRFSCIQPNFIRVRQKEITSLKRFLGGQKFIRGTKGYYDIFIDHNLTPNPILLKGLILKDFLEVLYDLYHLKREVFEESSSFDKSSSLLKIKGYSDCLLSVKDIEGYESNVYNIIQLGTAIIELCYDEALYSIEYRSALEDNCYKYIVIMICWDIVRGLNSKSDKKYVLDYFKGIFRTAKDDDARRVLIDNAFAQILLAPNFSVSSEVSMNEGYNDYLIEQDYLFSVIRDYCDFDNEINCTSEGNEVLTYYTDLYLFEQLSYMTELFKKIKDY